eukprot:TRINITY_DN7457_c0_g1_i3.p1 TRINITY_DN7457_c0_g1~~TRINITY_DN7457_c0_g1_i3.p1  ORF type:complete len:284 (-),score=41.17 TRINITY_DN7457_c0_g1_i3:35-886(-)
MSRGSRGRRLSFLDDNHSCCYEFCRATPWAGVGAFVVALTGILLCAATVEPTAAATRGHTPFARHTAESLDGLLGLLAFLLFIDVVALLAGCLSGGRRREYIMRSAGWLRCFLAACCLPAAHLGAWLAIIVALLMSYSAFSALVIISSVAVICASGEDAQKAAADLSDAVLVSLCAKSLKCDKGEGTYMAKEVNKNFPEVCNDIGSLGQAPAALFTGTLLVLIGQMIVLWTLELYNKRVKLEAALFDKKYDDEGTVDWTLNVSTRSSQPIPNRRDAIVTEMSR